MAGKYQGLARVTDPGIPTLRTVLASSELTEHLRGVLPGIWGALHHVDMQILRHHPASRCVVDMRLKTTTGEYELIGKVYARDRSDVFRAMDAFSKINSVSKGAFALPQTVAFVEKLRLLLQEKVFGSAATKTLAEGSEQERAAVVERCALWLANFHNEAPPLGPAFRPTYELMSRWLSLTQKRNPLAEKVQLLFKQLQSAMSTLDDRELCASHGDFSHRQIILAGPRTIVFDWDSYCVAHPARDVAKFTLKLQQLAQKVFGKRNALDTSIELFQSTYLAASRFAVKTHVPLYKAVHCLKHAKFDSQRIQKTEELLDEGLRILAEEM
jgi:aminoglycoside phosphotransferase (APT) family kinase protein